jgi:hypothetical protein
MVSIPNRFYRGIVHSPKNQKHPNFRFIIIDTIKEIQDENGYWYTDSFESQEEFLLHNPELGETFYGVYGSYWIDIPKSSLKITETHDLMSAIYVAEQIMGSEVIEVSSSLL